MRIDLHMHSTASDGAKTPAELVRYCFETCGVGTMALTDHDTVAGVAEARRTAQLCGMRFVNGIEVSTIWSQRSVHIVGLGVDDNNAELLETTADLCDKRDRRAVEMGRKLEALGYPGMFEKALGKTRVKANVSRLHFAQALLEAGAVKNIQEAFDRYLTEGKPAYVAAAWPSVAEAVALIHRAGGVAVLAHPGRYRFKNGWQLDAWLKALSTPGARRLKSSAAVRARRLCRAASSGPSATTSTGRSEATTTAPAANDPRPARRANCPPESRACCSFWHKAATGEQNSK